MCFARSEINFFDRSLSLSFLLFFRSARELDLDLDLDRLRLRFFFFFFFFL